MPKNDTQATACPRCAERERRDVDGPVEPRWAKIMEVGIYVGLSERTIRQMLADGRLTPHRIGERIVRVDLNEVDAVLVAEPA